MAALTREQVIEANDAETVEIEVPEWGGSILLRSMTGKQRNDYEFWALQRSESDKDFRGIRERGLCCGRRR